MSAIILPFRLLLAHLWLHPTAGGWVTVTADKVDPDWPPFEAEWLPTTKAARVYAQRIADRHRARLLVHGGEF